MFCVRKDLTAFLCPLLLTPDRRQGQTPHFMVSEARGVISATSRQPDNNRKAKFYGLTARGRKQLETQRKSGNGFPAPSK